MPSLNARPGTRPHIYAHERNYVKVSFCPDVIAFLIQQFRK